MRKCVWQPGADIEEMRLASEQGLEKLSLTTKRDMDEFRLATKRDLEEMRQATKRDLKELEYRLTIRVGGMLVVVVGVLAAMKFFG